MSQLRTITRKPRTSSPPRAFRYEFQKFKAAAERLPRGFEIDWADRKPCLDDRTAGTAFDRHYVYHTAWAARVVRRIAPAAHIDVSSSLYFSAIVSAFIPVRYYEYRPVKLRIDDALTTGTADLMSLPFDDCSVASISCMHVVEHVGLGRYRDPIDADADLRAMSELKRVVAPGGSLLLVVPVGRARVQFNAHRIYAFDQIVEAFDGLDLAEFALVPDGRFDRGIVIGASREFTNRQNYGCGCFWFRRSSEGQRP